MSLVALHGPAVSSSRTRLLNIKSKFNSSNVVIFEKGADLQNILATLMTPTLLSDPQLIILENPPEDLTFDSSLITYHLSLILWFDHEINAKKPIYKFIQEKGEVLFFPEGKEVSVFPFLDKLGFRDKQAYLELDKLKKSGADTQYLITMILYLLRSLSSPSKKSPKFVTDKILKQQKNFPKDEIINLYRFVLETDFKIKVGLIENKHAEFMIINRFLVG